MFNEDIKATADYDDERLLYRHCLHHQLYIATNIIE